MRLLVALLVLSCPAWAAEDAPDADAPARDADAPPDSQTTAAEVVLAAPADVPADADAPAAEPSSTPAGPERPPPPRGVRGGAFEVGGTVGAAVWDQGLGLEPCAWFGGFAGHRFAPLAERFHLGFRAGWEGCVTDQKVTGSRVDMILIDIAFTYGVKPADWVIVYGLTGGGFLIADTTPSGGKPFPRMAFQGGGGAAFVLGSYFYVDASVRILGFENIQFGGFGGTTGTVASPVFSLSLGGHI